MPEIAIAAAGAARPALGTRPFTVKICGVRTPEGAQAAVDAGADMLGFICYPPARRYLPPDRIAAILGGLRGRSAIQAVGVLVNQPAEEMNALALTCGLDLIQLSGDEPVALARRLVRPVVKAVRPDQRTFAEAARLARRAGLRALLLESSQGGWGGQGAVMDWSLARAITALPDRPPITLAGGLTPDNVAVAIRAAEPDGVDVSSGVERNGAQDPARIAAFIGAARRARMEESAT
jgi:phosphoribosylanthranilate isomerase